MQKVTVVCDHCGKTEDQNEEDGYGPLVPVKIDIDPHEELGNYTGDRYQGGWAHLCNDGFIEYVQSQPQWLREMFERNNPTHYPTGSWS